MANLVLVKQNFFAGGAAYHNSHFGHGSGLILLDEVRCFGFESKLVDCTHSGFGVLSYCDHGKDAGVRCSKEPTKNCSNGDIRLMNGTNPYEGRVEMCYHNRFATICHDNWDYLDATVVCHQLGYSGMLEV